MERVMRVLVWAGCLLFCGAFWGLVIYALVGRR